MSYADLGSRLVAAGCACGPVSGQIPCGGIATGSYYAKTGTPIGGIATGSYYAHTGTTIGGTALGSLLGNANPSKAFLTSGLLEGFAPPGGKFDPSAIFGYPDTENAAWQLPAGAYNYFLYGFNEGAVQMGFTTLLAGGAVAGVLGYFAGRHHKKGKGKKR